MGCRGNNTYASLPADKVSGGRVQNILFLVPLLVAGAAVLYLVGSYDSIPVNVDAGYYLSIAREVAGGAIPTVDVTTSYPPGVYYILAVGLKLAGPEFKNSLLLVYFVHLFNCLLLYKLLRFFLEDAFLRTMLALTYFFSVYYLEGYFIVLEPFQILFALAAYLAYLYGRSGTAGYVAAGFLMGCSIMCKQYSVLLFAGLLVSIYLDSRGQVPGRVIINRVCMAAIAAVCPYLIFIALTGARIPDSLHSFAFLRLNPAYYLSQGRWDIVARAKDLVWRSFQAHWLFIPLPLYILSRSFRKDPDRARLSVIPLMLASMAPLLVRQYSHYYQLIAPWSIILLAVALNNTSARGEVPEERNNRDVLTSFILCSTVLLPAFLCGSPYFTADLYVNHKMQIVSVMALYSFSITAALAIGWYRSGYPFGLRSLTLLASAFIFFEVVFICLRLPLHEWKAAKTLQDAEAANIHRVFSAQTPVLAPGYPELYITGNFTNPLRNYDLVFPEPGNRAKTINEEQWKATRNVIVRRQGTAGLQEELRRRGFAEVESPGTPQLILFTKR